MHILLGYKCPDLKASNNSVVQSLLPNKQYYVGCTGQRAMFGPFSIYGEYAICVDGDYVIYAHGSPIKIGDMVPSCVSKLIFSAFLLCWFLCAVKWGRKFEFIFCVYKVIPEEKNS